MLPAWGLSEFDKDLQILAREPCGTHSRELIKEKERPKKETCAPVWTPRGEEHRTQAPKVRRLVVGTSGGIAAILCFSPSHTP